MNFSKTFMMINKMSKISLQIADRNKYDQNESECAVGRLTNKGTAKTMVP